MELFIALVVLVIAIFWFRSRSTKPSSDSRVVEHAQREPRGQQVSSNTNLQEARLERPKPTTETKSRGITREFKDIPEVLIDLRANAERSFRVVGSSHWVESKAINEYKWSYFFLHREPNNIHDENAIAVFGGTRKFGYLSAGAAKQYAPLLDRVGSHFLVHRDDKDLARMWLRLPRIPVLRKLIENSGVSYWNLDYDELNASEPPPVIIPTPGPDVTSGYPRIAGPYSNGDQVFGFYDDFAANLREAGTPTVSSLRRASITQAIRNVRVGDRLPVQATDGALWVSKNGERVGQLNWKDDEELFDGGVVEVQRVFIGIEGDVVNCGGKALPKDH